VIGVWPDGPSEVEGLLDTAAIAAAEAMPLGGVAPVYVAGFEYLFASLEI
jgi:hypothetical protein